jgi:hypothetical protein
LGLRKRILGDKFNAMMEIYASFPQARGSKIVNMMICVRLKIADELSAKKRRSHLCEYTSSKMKLRRRNEHEMFIKLK